MLKTLIAFEDDHGSSQTTSTPLTYNGSGRWSSSGNIEYSGDEDWFRWTAPADTKAIQVTMDPGGDMLWCSVALLDSQGDLVKPFRPVHHRNGSIGYSNAAGSSAVFTHSIIPGAVYYIWATIYFGDSVGLYAVTLETLEDDHGSTPTTATPLTFNTSGKWASIGIIEYHDDEDWFSWTAPKDATIIQVTMDALGSMSPLVQLIDSNGIRVGSYGSSDEAGGSTVFTNFIFSGMIYYIGCQKTVDKYSLGSYTVTLTTIKDDHGSTPETATPLIFNNSGRWSSAGMIEYSDDDDWFSWTAPKDVTVIQVTMDAAGSMLAPFFVLRDKWGNSYDLNNYKDSPGGSAVFTDSIIPGDLYYFQCRSNYVNFVETIGPYIITLTTLKDDYGSTPVTAKSLPSLAPFSLTGQINFSLDHDWFKWVVPLGLNRVRISMVNMGLPSQLMVLSIRNMNQIELTGVSVLGGNLQAVLLLDVVPGSTYYLDASGASTFNSGIYQIFVYPIRMEQIVSQTVGSTDLNFGISMAIITQSGATGSGSTPSDGLATILLPSVGSAGGDVSNLATIQVADEIIGGSDFVINSGGSVGVSLRDTIRNIKDAQEQLLIELRGFFAIIHTGALEMLLFDADGKTSRLPRQWKLAMAPWVDGVMMELHTVDRQAAILFDLTSSGLKRVTAIVPPVWFDTVPAFTLEYATPDADEPTSPWWASVVLMVGAKTWRIKKKSRLKV
jgi:hypothetical protein